MPALNIIELNVDNKTHSYARVYSSLINDEYQRKRAYASLVALFSLTNLLDKTKNSIQKSMTLFRQPKLNEEFEISDFYVNNWHIDVRILVDGDAVLLPKKHFENNILPDFYAVVKVDKSLNNAELLGFIDPQTVNKQPLDYHYFSTTLDSLIPYSEFLTRIENQKVVSFAEEEHQKFKEKYLSLLDDELDAETKSSLLRHMFACPICRTEFCCFTGFEMVSCHMGKYPDLMEDQTLNIIGATAVESEEYKDKEEEVISIVDDEQEKEQEQQNQEESSQQFDEADEILEETENLQEEKIEDVSSDINDDIDVAIVEDEPLDNLSILDDVQVNEIKNIQEETNQDDFGIIENALDADDLIVEDFEENSEKQILIAEMPENNLEIDNTSVSEIIEEKEETVSDILDELFSIDEIYEDTSVQEKSIDIKPKEDSYIEEISPSEEFVENYTDEFSDDFDDSKDIDFIERDLKIVNEDQKDFENIDFEYDDLENNDEPSELEIHGDFAEQPQVSKQVEPIEDIDIQNVIVDYDEMGNPIYSYITDIPEEQTSQISSEIDDVEDYDILDEQYETYSSLDENDQTQAQQNINEEVVYDDFQEEMPEVNDATIEEEFFDDVNEQEQPLEDDINDDGYSSGFNDENYVDETDESLPEERQAKSNPLIPIILLFGFVFAIAFSGYKIYNNMVANEKKDVVEQVAEVQQSELPPVEEIATEIVDDELLASEGNNEKEAVKVETPVATAEQKVNQVPVPDNLPKLPEVAPTSNNIDLPPLTEKDLLPNKQKAENISKSMASAFSANTATASVKNINWLCTPQLFTDTSFKSFLQDIDGLLKLNMRKNILNATESPKNTVMSVKMAIDNNGKIERMMIADSSGSEQIDNIVLQSINESLTGKKSPILNDSKLKADRYHLKVVIKL